MNRLDQWLDRRSIRIVLRTLLIAAFLAYGAVHVYPYVDDITPENSAGDDWLDYKVFANSILDGGLHIPFIDGPYYIPGGFLYNYFVAAIFAVSGRNPAYVYVVQFGCLALSAVLMSMLARRFMSATLSTVYMFVTAFFLLLTFRWWVIRLLSENITIVLYPIVLMLLVRAIEKKSLGRFAAAGFVCGLLVLTRSNLIGVPVLLALLGWWSGDRLGARVKAAGVFGVFSVLGMSFLPLRNFYVTHQLMSTRYARLLPLGTPGEIAVIIGKRFLFTAGIAIGGLNLKGSQVLINKSWLAVVLVSVGALVYLIVKRRVLPVDAACVLMVIAAFGPFLVLPKLGGYGFRFQHPYGPLLLFLIFRAAHEWLPRRASPAPYPQAAPAA